MATLTTPIYGLPYPDGTERVADGDNAIGALAQAVESTFGAVLAALRYERRSVAFGTTSGVEVTLTFPEVQNDAGHGVLTIASGVVTVARAGWVVVSAGVVWPANASGFRQLFLVSPAGIYRASTRDVAPASGGLPQTIGDAWYVTAGQTIEARVEQSSGGGSNVAPDPRTHISVLYLGT